MDPLGARPQFVDIQSLSTWDQPAEVKEGEEEEDADRTKNSSPTNQQWPFPSPFPYRDDINRKIALL